MTVGISDTAKKCNTGTKEKNVATTPYGSSSALTHKTSYDLESECLAHMAANNCQFEGPIIADEKIHRFSRDHKKNEEDEWYWATESTTEIEKQGLMCVYGSWSDPTIKFQYSSFDKNSQHLSKEEIEWHKKECRKKLKDAEAARKEDEKLKVEKAARVWEKASSNPSTKAHTAYLERKKIKAYGIKFAQAYIQRDPSSKAQPSKEDCLVIKLQNAKREVRAVQYIFSDGEKRFLGPKKGNYFLLGSVKENSHIFVCEGYATAANIFEAFDEKQPVFVAFDCGNLEAVVAAIRKKCPLHKITIASDDDCETDNNQGQHHAERAAKFSKCRNVKPTFPSDFKLPNGKRATDFNDLHVHFGLEEVQKQLATEEQKAVIAAEKVSEDILKQKKPNERFATEDLPKVISNYLDELSQYSKADPIMRTGALISTISGHFKTNHYIPQGTYFQDLYPVAWFLNILESGGFKSTSQNLGSEIASITHDEVLNEVDQAERAYLRENELEYIDAKTKDAVFAELYKKDVTLPNLTTAQGLLEDLSRGRGGTIFLHELSVWLSKMEASYNEGLKELFTYLFDVPKSFDIKTKTGGTIRIERPFVSIYSLSALDGIKDQINLSDIGSGFFARFLIFLPEKIDETPPALPSIKDRSRIEAARNEVRHILNIAASQKRSYSLSEETKQLFEMLHNKMYDDFRQYDDHAKKIVEPYIKRWSPYLLKLAMIFQPFFEKDIARNNQVLGHEALVAASSIMALAISGTKHLFSHELGQSPHQVKCQKVICYIAKNNGSIPRRTLLQSKCLDGGANDYNYVLKTLLETGQIKELGTPVEYILCKGPVR